MLVSGPGGGPGGHHLWSVSARPGGLAAWGTPGCQHSSIHIPSYTIIYLQDSQRHFTLHSQVYFWFAHMCLYCALNLYCSSLWNTRMVDIAEKCDEGGEQEPDISADIYSAHIWWLVAGGRCGHTLKINTNNARSPIPYTPYSYTPIHCTHSLILQPELWRVKSSICTRTIPDIPVSTVSGVVWCEL